MRAIRTERRLSLAETSRLTGMSVATLSKVENGKRTLAYDKLVALAGALNVDIARLFASAQAPATPPAAAGRRSVQHVGEGFEIGAGVYTYTYLAHDLSRKRLSPVIMDLHARSLAEFDALLRHDGEEHVFVLEGEVLVHTDVYEPLHLKAGDSLYIDSSTGHAYLNAGPGRARILCTASAADAPHAVPAAPATATRTRRTAKASA